MEEKFEVFIRDDKKGGKLKIAEFDSQKSRILFNTIFSMHMAAIIDKKKFVKEIKKIPNAIYFENIDKE
jgi:hypothetical protein